MMKSKITFLTLTFSIFIAFLAKAQMEIGGETLYGNEWIDYDQDHYKITIEKDGIYRLTYQELNAAGVFSGTTTPTGAELKIYHMGQLVPIHVSTTGMLGNNDYVEFYGLKNRGEIDMHLYIEADDQFNPRYSMFTDVSSYFLTWNAEPGLFFSEIANDLSNPPTAEAFCMYLEEQVYSGAVERGRDYGSGSWKCRYDEGEGFGKSTFSINQSFSFDLSDRAAVGADATISTRLFSETGTHAINVELNNNLVTSDNYSNWDVRQITGAVTANNLIAGNNTVQVTGNGSLEDDKFRLSIISIDYPRTFNFGGAELAQFSIPTAAGKRYLEINNFNVGSQSPILYDITNNLRLTTQLNGSTVRAVLPAATGEREIVLVSEGGIASPLSLAKRTFINYDFSNTSYNYVMLTHPSLLDDGSGNNYIQDYADYRSSMQGGDYTPIIVDITQVYDQFGYGIDRHEMAMKNCMELAAIHWSPKLLFIIGKGVTYGLMRNNAADWQQYSFVPSFGYPSSDHLITAPIGGSVPSMGVGRLAAKNHNDIRIYLNKVKEYEAVPDIVDQTLEDKEWMKKILHFGGGDAAIQDLIRNELNALKDTIEQSNLAGNVTSFFKDCADVVCPVDPDQAVPMINDGALMLTFFGHSAPSTLDFDLGDPNEYDNQGKYPFFYAIGCNTNRIFETESTLSEDFVLIEDKGCIGFFGATWITSLGNLSQYGKYFYNNLGTDNYGETLGEIIKATIEDYNFSTSYTAELLRNGLILHGDPAIKLYPFEGPDYLVKKTESEVTQTVVNVLQDSFTLDLVVSNLGRGVEDSINIRLEHELPNGDILDLGVQRINAPGLNAYLSYNLPLVDDNGVIGLNYIKVTVDVDDEVLELPSGAESNNEERIAFFVVANDIFPVFPYEFSITSDESPILKASTANAFSEALDYYFEIDTTELFDSPMKVSNVQNSIGGVLDWQPSIPMIDSTVYYWRVSIDSSAISGGFNWHNSSFIYIPDNYPGWNQSHYFQTIKDGFEDYEILETREQTFGMSESEYGVENGTLPNIGPSAIKIFKDGFAYYGFANCGEGTNTIWINVFDPVTLEVKPTAPGEGANFNCFPSDAYVSITNPNTFEGRQKTMNFLQNEIEDGEYVIIFTTQNVNQDFSIDEWAADSITEGTNIFQLLEAQGATQIRDMIGDPTPYVFMYKQNDPSFLVTEVKAVDFNEIISATSSFEGIARSGKIISTQIGPATAWETLLWDVSEYNPTEENVNIDVVGIDVNGNETVLLDSVTVYDQSLSSIDAVQYPYIKLVYTASDPVNHTTPQLDYWRVLFDPIPEAALVPNKNFTFYSDTLQQGDELVMEIGIENISEENMDSLLMHYTVIDAQNNLTVYTERLQPLVVDGLILGQLTVDTRDLAGNNQLIIEANPNDDQLELHHYNNIGVKSFFVEGDNRNPLLDVTFDGIHIMDGDLVSSIPEISITLLDENPYLALTDTSLLRLFVTDPLGQVEEYEVDGDILTFYPASGNLANENRARMEFRPELLIDGTYQLQVRGKDVSGNNSGDLDYRVSFEVINEESVSNVLNYPNPFSTSTQFVFTLTGNELPDVFRIQIMTVSGKIVKEIDMSDLGLLRIGNNISDYRWDGTDDYGDKLANGVYLYRVIVRKNGEDYDSYDNGTNQYFKKGFGKLVILR